MSFMRSLFIIAACTLLASGAAARRLKGVMTQLASQYETGDQFTCLKSGTSIPSTYVNDDYCDCEDGTDEPGTSACANLLVTGKMAPDFLFQCDVHATTPLVVGTLVKHSQVNDGLCDCCDGSDEYTTDAACANTCAADAERHEKEARERERRRQAGLKAKTDMLAEANKKRSERQTEKDAAVAALQSIDADLRAAEEAKVKAEATENAERDRIRAKSIEEKAKWEADREKKKSEEAALKQQEEALRALELPPSTTTVEVPNQAPPAPEIQCKSWRQTQNCQGTGVRESDKDRPCTDVIDGGASGFCECFNPSKKDEELHPFDCGHKVLRCADICRLGPENPAAFVDGASTASAPPAEESFKLDDGSSYNLPEANDARARLSELQNKKQTNEETVRKADDILTKSEYGANGVFMSMIGRCYDKEEGSQYSYSLCPFDEMKQVSRTGGGVTSMGRWKGWGEQTYSFWGSKQDLSKMIYEGGTHCWGGPSRSTEVTVICGETNAILSVEEPSMCTYKAVFQTPAACTDD